MLKISTSVFTVYALLFPPCYVTVFRNKTSFEYMPCKIQIISRVSRTKNWFRRVTSL